MTKAQILEWWDLWILWRLVGMDVQKFTAARSLPKSMLDTFFFLDDFLGRMEAKKLKEEAQRNKAKR